jgi:hypothetical protein
MEEYRRVFKVSKAKGIPVGTYAKLCLIEALNNIEDNPYAITIEE